MSDNISRVKEAINIIDIVGEFVDLKKAGKNYKGLCPFHKEKTPSFVVSEERGTYKCFGCGESGDVFSFLMKRDNMTFPETLDYLADKAGIVLDNTINTRKEKIDLEKYYRINDDARKFFYQNLLTNKFSRAYLRQREISDYTINEFSLGYARDSWDSLLGFLTSQGHKLEDLLDLGLVAKSQKGTYYDTFRNRLIFPIFNISGRIIGFGGRTLGEDRAKYINSQESPIYHKGSQLFGLNLIHNSNDRDKLILVEGYMDVIGLRQSGVKNTVAALGTALTQAQAKLTSRYAKQIYLCYDSDPAGIKATLRAIETYEELKIYPKVIVLDKGMDPDDFIKKYGKEAFDLKVKEASNHIDFKLGLVLEGADISDPSKMDRVLNSLSQVINPIESQVLKDEYIDKVAKKLNINPMSLSSDLGKLNFKPRTLRARDKSQEKLGVPFSLILAYKFSLRSKEYFLELRPYLASQEAYGLDYLLTYLDKEYDLGGSISLDRIKEDLNLSDKQIAYLSFTNIKDEQAAYKELCGRIMRFNLEEEKSQLKADISMLSSILDKNPDKETDLKDMLGRLAKIEVELKTNKSWRN